MIIKKKQEEAKEDGLHLGFQNGNGEIVKNDCM